jgi:hypothetical protein
MRNTIRTSSVVQVSGRDQAKEVLEMDQDLGKEVLVGEGLEKELGLAKGVRAGEVLEMDQERGDGVPVVQVQEITGLVCLTQDMLKIQNLFIHWRPERKDTREKFC